MNFEKQVFPEVITRQEAQDLLGNEPLSVLERGPYTLKSGALLRKSRMTGKFSIDGTRTQIDIEKQRAREIDKPKDNPLERLRPEIRAAILKYQERKAANA